MMYVIFKLYTMGDMHDKRNPYNYKAFASYIKQLLYAQGLYFTRKSIALRIREMLYKFC